MSEEQEKGLVLAPRVERVQLALGEGGEDAFFALVEEGKSIAKIARRLGCSSTSIHAWLDAGEGRRAKLAQARAVGADYHADRAGEVLEELVGQVPTAPEVTLANSRSNYHRWLAGVQNRDVYGDKPQAVNVQVSINQLHLDALRQAGAVVHVPPAATVEAEIIEEGEGA